MYSDLKKVILSIFTFAMLSIIFSSCSNDENRNIDNEKIFKNLENFNSTTINQNLSSKKKCSGFWDCLGYVSQVAGADIIGAGTGVVVVKEAAAAFGAVSGGTGAVVVMAGAGVVCGAGASYAAARTADPNYIKTNIEFGNLNLKIPTEYSGFQNIGIKHNNVIHNNFYYGEPIENFYSNYNVDENKILKSSIVLNANQILKLESTNYVNNNFDYKIFTQKMVDKNYYTINMKRVTDLFLEKYFSCTENIEIENTINFYINEVSNSNLLENEKQALIASFIVASQSPFYLLDNK